MNREHKPSGISYPSEILSSLKGPYPKIFRQMDDDAKGKLAVIICDPFDKGYNPARTVLGSTWNEYVRAFSLTAHEIDSQCDLSRFK
jgi:hypothetical protein